MFFPLWGFSLTTIFSELPWEHLWFGNSPFLLCTYNLAHPLMKLFFFFLYHWVRRNSHMAIGLSSGKITDLATVDATGSALLCVILVLTGLTCTWPKLYHFFILQRNGTPPSRVAPILRKRVSLCTSTLGAGCSRGCWVPRVRQLPRSCGWANSWRGAQLWFVSSQHPWQLRE